MARLLRGRSVFSLVRVALIVTATVGLSGCGGSSDRPDAAATPTPDPSRAATPAAKSAAEQARPVIKGWSDALRGSDVDRAIDYFALPSVLAQGPAYKVTTRAQLRIFNAGLPCGARLQGVERAGRYVVGTFRLTERPGKTCDGPGNLARVAFRIRDGKIAEWRQLPAPASPDAPQAPLTET